MKGEPKGGLQFLVGQEQDGTKLLFGEAFITILGDGWFELGHPFIESQEVGTVDAGGVKSLVTQFS